MMMHGLANTKQDIQFEISSAINQIAEGTSLPKLQDNRSVPNPATVVPKVPIVPISFGIQT